MQRTALHLADLQSDVVLANVERGRLRYALYSTEAKGATLTAAPGIHVVVAGEGQDVADAARYLHDLRAEAGEGDHCGPGNDRHLGEGDLLLFRALRAVLVVEVSARVVIPLL